MWHTASCYTSSCYDASGRTAARYTASWYCASRHSAACCRPPSVPLVCSHVGIRQSESSLKAKKLWYKEAEPRLCSHRHLPSCSTDFNTSATVSGLQWLLCIHKKEQPTFRSKVGKLMKGNQYAGSVSLAWSICIVREVSAAACTSSFWFLFVLTRTHIQYFLFLVLMVSDGNVLRHTWMLD
jgi:hypothetical protein